VPEDSVRQDVYIHYPEVVSESGLIFESGMGRLLISANPVIGYTYVLRAMRQSIMDTVSKIKKKVPMSRGERDFQEIPEHRGSGNLL
jgi:hypothetical protein